MSDSRPFGRERRSFPRPPLWLNLLLLVIAAATFAYARHERDLIDARFSLLFQPSANSPAELNRMRDELSRMDLTQAQLTREIDGRMQYLQSLQSAEFYLSIDTRRKKLQFRLGPTLVREADVQIGEAKTIKSPTGRTWTFLPLKGGFGVTGKEERYNWSVPEWVYAMRGEREPPVRAVVPNGLGRYVIFLPDGYLIHSPPPPGSPLQGPKPGSFMVSEADLAALWPRITNQTRVYIF
ncbi:MAG TPA: hypothetical protein VLC46_22580 [Thermoanaerobaculia bacterium]|jgi:hypothetical protein|nr:hypothetical protein [Thermoanaerobaculia bacterium]